MNILCVVYGRFPTEKAYGLQTAKVCEALGRVVHTTLVVPSFRGDENDACSFYGLQKTFEIKRIEAQKVGKSAVLYFFRKLTFLRRVAEYIESNQADGIITRETLLLLFSKQKIILELHNLPRIRWPYIFLWERAHKIIVKTTALRDDLLACGMSSEKIVVMPNAVDLDMFSGESNKKLICAQVGIPEKKPLILYIGSLGVWKGVETLLEAAAKLPGFTIGIVGGCDNEIASLKEKYQNTNIAFFGRKSHTDIPFLMSSADLLVLPNSKKMEVSERYTSPLKLFEYFAARRPVVASRLSSIQEIASEDMVSFFSSDDSEDLSAVIRDTVQQKESASSKVKKAYEYVRGHTWDAYAARVCEIIRT